MLRNLATSLINSRSERIVTTLPKAKELRPFVERVITLSRQAKSLEGEDSEVRAVHLRRRAAGFFHAGNSQQATLSGRRGLLRLPRTAGVAALKRLFDELGERYKDRPGGYTRILKLGQRAGDNAELAIIELVDNPRELRSLEEAKKRSKSAGAKKKRSAEEKRANTAGRNKSEGHPQPTEAAADGKEADLSGSAEAELDSAAEEEK